MEASLMQCLLYWIVSFFSLRTMATQETTPDSQTEESNALDLPSAYDMRDYVLQRPSQETNSEAFSSEEACSIPCSSDVDPGKKQSLKQTNIKQTKNSWHTHMWWFVSLPSSGGSLRNHSLSWREKHLSETVGRDFKGQPPWWNQGKEWFPGGPFVWVSFWSPSKYI